MLRVIVSIFSDEEEEEVEDCSVPPRTGGIEFLPCNGGLPLPLAFLLISFPVLFT